MSLDVVVVSGGGFQDKAMAMAPSWLGERAEIYSGPTENERVELVEHGWE
mgnify:CR=1 FL=1